MCGITGYVGSKNAVPILLEGLLKLEYRGYDSAGIALLKNGILRVCKKKGRVGTLAEEVRKMNFSANTGISHTRWATHGGVTDANAHPHVSSDGNFALVHNGIIENFENIKNFLLTKGYTFSSQTDSEVLVNLIAYHYSQRTDENTENRFMEAVRKALLHVEGTYGIAVLCRFNDGEIVAARKGSPLLIGVGKNERLVSSDVLGFAGRVTADSCDIVTICNKPINYTVSEIDWNLESADLGNCKHYMQKEIMEQPAVLENAIRGRISDDGSTAVLNGLNMTPADMRQIDRILFCACGTAWHACLVAEYLIEKYDSLGKLYPMGSDYEPDDLKTRTPHIQKLAAIMCEYGNPAVTGSSTAYDYKIK